MRGLLAELAVIESIAARSETLLGVVDVLIRPPATLIVEAARIAAGRLAIGGQNCHC
jgi:triosephosphate isomerase